MRTLETWNARNLVTLSEKNDELPNPLIYALDGEEILDALADIDVTFDPDGFEWGSAMNEYWAIEEVRQDGPNCVLIFTDCGTYGVPADTALTLYLDDSDTEE